MKRTPGPWDIEPYDEHGGYDCMYGAIRVGPVTLDGCDYGQLSCDPIEPAALEQMQGDARLISAAPDLLAALRALEPYFDALVCYASSMDEHNPNRLVVDARAAIAKAEGEK